MCKKAPLWHWVILYVFLFLICTQLAACLPVRHPSDTYARFPLPTSTKRLNLQETPTDLHPTITPITHDIQATHPAPLPEMCSDIASKVRITYVTFEENNDNKLVGSSMYFLDPPYITPHQIYTSNNGETINVSNLQPVLWTNDLQKVSFSVSAGDTSRSVYVYDDATKNVLPVLTSINSEYQVIFPRFSWDPTEKWLSVLIDEGYAIQSHIINVNTGETTILNYQSQEQVLAWHPLRAGEFITMSYPDFPNEDKVVIALRVLGQETPVKTFIFPDGYTILMDWRRSFFSISPDGNLAVFKSQTVPIGTSSLPIYLFLTLDTGEWAEYLPQREISVTPFWSSDNRYLTFSSKTGLQILDVTEHHLINIPSNVTAKPLAWLSDRLVFENSHKVYSISPRRPETLCLIQDISAIVSNISPPFWINILPEWR